MNKEERKLTAKIAVAVAVMLIAIASVGLFYIKF